VRTAAIATLVAVGGGFLGSQMISKWQVSVGSLTLAAGIIFFLVALRMLLHQYEPEPPAAPAQQGPADPTSAALGLIFPVALTPYGIAGVIVLLTTSGDWQRTLVILGLLLLVMMLDLFAMMFARIILKGPAMIVLKLVGAVMGVLQVALSIELIHTGMRSSGLLPG
jgi:multiple antibiotic resistance protein